MKKQIILLTLIAALAFSGCSGPSAPAASPAAPSAPPPASTPTPTPAAPESPAPESPTPTPTTDMPLPPELLQELVTTGNQGGLPEFLQAHPDFLWDRSNRVKMNTGDELVDGGERALLLLTEGVDPAQELVNRERLAKFAENYKAGIPDSIVILWSGNPIPLWITTVAYSGNGTEYTVTSGFPLQGKWREEYSFTLEKLEETDKEWLLLNEKFRKLRYPKYGYEPIPWQEPASEATMDNALTFIEALRITDYPETAKTVASVNETGAERLSVPCYIIDLQDALGNYTGYSFALAKDGSHFYQNEQVQGDWLLMARPRAAA